MVKFTIALLGAIAALTGNVAAQAPIGTTCVPSQFYCGSHLLNNGATFNLWKARIDAALTARGLPADGEHEFNSLFFCSAPDAIALDEFCFDTPGNRCQPANARACTGSNPLNQNDCCGPSI